MCQKCVTARLTNVDDADVHSECVAGEIGYIAHVITQIPKRRYPVRDGGPDRYPDHDLRVQCDIMLGYYIVDGVVEQRDKSRDANNGQRLTAEDTEDDRRKCR